MRSTGKRAWANVLGVEVEAIDMKGAITRIAAFLKEDIRGYICLAGVHGIMEAQRSPAIADVYRHSLMNAPDGMPTVWVGHAQGHYAMDRVAGPELMLEVLSRPEFAHCTHYLYGGKVGVAEELRNMLAQRFPGIHIVGTYTPPFRDFTPEEEIDFLNHVRACRPDIVWIGIGAPRQELFMRRYQQKLGVCLMFGVGAAFDYHTGRLADSPEWVKRAGLNWLHRLVQDPRHLFWRYLRNNPSFLWHIAWQLCGIRTYTTPHATALPQNGMQQTRDAELVSQKHITLPVRQDL